MNEKRRKKIKAGRHAIKITCKLFNQYSEKDFLPSRGFNLLTFFSLSRLPFSYFLHNHVAHILTLCLLQMFLFIIDTTHKERRKRWKRCEKCLHLSSHHKLELRNNKTRKRFFSVSQSFSSQHPQKKFGTWIIAIFTHFWCATHCWTQSHATLHKKNKKVINNPSRKNCSWYVSSRM